MPSVAVIDDKEEGETLKSLLSKTVGFEVDIYHPRDVTLQIIKDADLVLIDYKLEDSEWPERGETLSAALQPTDGIALSIVLRRHLASLAGVPPTAFALLTSFIGDISASFPHGSRNHQIARCNNLEWVFEKADSDENALASQIQALACAVEDLPSSWGMSDETVSDEFLLKLMGLTESDNLATRLLEDVRMSKPPLHELSEWSHGIAYLRWILHRVFPHPCFLIDKLEVCRRIRVAPQALDSELSTGSALADELNKMEYKGILSGFRGKRWWRSSLEQFLWNKTNGESSNPKSVKALIASTSSTGMDHTDIQYPTAAIDHEFKTINELFDLDQCVRIQPDDWPSFADQPFTTIALATEYKSLSSLVIQKDKCKLPDDA